MLYWSHPHICTHFDNHMLTCLLALMITCFYVHVLWWSYTYINYRMLPCLHALIRTCPFACMPWCSCAQTILWLHAPMFTWFVNHMLLCSHASMIECFSVYILWWSHAHFPVPLQAYVLGCFDDYLLLCWNSFVHMLTFIDIYMCTLVDNEMSIGLKAKVIV